MNAELARMNRKVMAFAVEMTGRSREEKRGRMHLLAGILVMTTRYSSACSPTHAVSLSIKGSQMAEATSDKTTRHGVCGETYDPADLACRSQNTWMKNGLIEG